MVNITGKLLDSETGEPVQFTLVAIGDKSTSTDLKGMFKIDVPAGKHPLKVRHQYYAPVTKMVDATTPKHIVVEMTRTVII